MTSSAASFLYVTKVYTTAKEHMNEFNNTILYSTVQYNTIQATNVHARNTFVNVTVVCGK